MISDSSSKNNVDRTIRQIYHNYIERLSKSDRLCLASLILNDLTQDIKSQPEQDLSDPRKFLSLSKEERDKLLEKQAREASKLYQPESELREWIDDYVDDFGYLSKSDRSVFTSFL